MGLVSQWRSRYGLCYVPITFMSVVFAAGTTWLLATNEQGQKIGTRERHLKCAGECVVFLKETGKYWECGEQLSEILGKLVNDTKERLGEHTGDGAGGRKHTGGAGKGKMKATEDEDMDFGLESSIATTGASSSQSLSSLDSEIAMHPPPMPSHHHHSETHIQVSFTPHSHTHTRPHLHSHSHSHSFPHSQSGSPRSYI